jgi:ABC-2 type transport system permease protein
VVAHLVRLKLTLLRNTLKKSVWQTVGLVVGILYGLGVISMALIGLAALGTTAPEMAGQIVTIVGTVVVLAWWVVPLFAFGVDATLDPQRFVTFAVPQRQLLAGLAVAGLVGTPGAVTLVASAGTSLAFWRTPLAALAALVGGLLAVALCVVGSRATTTALAPLLDSRRSREVLSIAAFVPLMLAGPIIGWATASIAQGQEVLPVIADVLAWTPFGAPWAIASAVAEGAWGLALARLAITLLVLVAAWVVWDRALAKALVSPRGGQAAGKTKGLGWFDRFPATPVGAVAARCMTYWFRDPRYSASIAIVPLMPVLLWFVGSSIRADGGGDGFAELMLVLGPVTAFTFGFSLSAEVAYDHTAFWTHVSSGITGFADRAGRVLAASVVSVPVVVLFAVGSVAFTGNWEFLVATVGLSLAVLATSLGVSSVVSARLLYPVAKPGDSPFKAPQGAAMATMVAQLITMGVLVVLCLPAAGLALANVLTGAVVWGWLALVVGVGLGVLFLVLGMRWGGRLVDQRGPELLQQVMSYK